LFKPLFATVAILWFVPHSFGQPADRRIDDAIAEITLLKRALAEQDRRITDLENTVRALQGSRAQNPALAAPTSPTPTGAWKSASAWARVKEGMSHAQVVAILGRPTSVKSLSPFETLFYQGDVPGSGSVTGTVELNNDRVWQINTPVF